jgi:hypothetical protein
MLPEVNWRKKEQTFSSRKKYSKSASVVQIARIEAVHASTLATVPSSHSHYFPEISFNDIDITLLEAIYNGLCSKFGGASPHWIENYRPTGFVVLKQCCAICLKEILRQSSEI